MNAVPFLYICPSDTYVTSFFGHAGYIVDSIGVVCSDGSAYGPTFGAGGGPKNDTCLAGFAELFVISGGYYFGGITPVCGGESLESIGIGGGALGAGATTLFSCPTSQRITGILGTAGQYVANFQVACGNTNTAEQTGPSPPPPPPLPSTPLPVPLSISGLVAWWPLNESSGSVLYEMVAGQDIVMGGSPSRVVSSYGSFSGHVLSVQTAEQSGFVHLLGVRSAFTISSWVQFSGISPCPYDQVWVALGTSGQCDGTNAFQYCETLEYGSECVGGGGWSVPSFLNTWYLFVYTFDGESTWHSYVGLPSGELVLSGTTSTLGTRGFSYPGVFSIGNTHNTYADPGSAFGGPAHGGLLGEVRVYNRPLSYAEVSQIFAGKETEPVS